MNARLYDPALMQFISPDPLVQHGSAFAYCSNNPLKYTDPTGMRPRLNGIYKHRKGGDNGGPLYIGPNSGMSGNISYYGNWVSDYVRSVSGDFGNYAFQEYNQAMKERSFSHLINNIGAVESAGDLAQLLYDISEKYGVEASGYVLKGEDGQISYVVNDYSENVFDNSNNVHYGQYFDPEHKFEIVAQMHTHNSCLKPGDYQGPSNDDFKASDDLKVDIYIIGLTELSVIPYGLTGSEEYSKDLYKKTEINMWSIGNWRNYNWKF